ncbi:unnamed protein product [Protopolystoma xenopodis]|uniref:Uncharacterized protein n=1 Tax=Protopolystoma xenopodis TaxID=117903 RepID=A0A448XNA3_9PLAT|nr:unnamed protein product [Protopolystoma xenopodis]
MYANLLAHSSQLPTICLAAMVSVNIVRPHSSCQTWQQTVLYGWPDALGPVSRLVYSSSGYLALLHFVIKLAHEHFNSCLIFLFKQIIIDKLYKLQLLMGFALLFLNSAIYLKCFFCFTSVDINMIKDKQMSRSIRLLTVIVHANYQWGGLIINSLGQTRLRYILNNQAFETFAKALEY